jgi:hypothetical protein
VSPGNTDILIPDLIGIPAQNVSAEQIIQATGRSSHAHGRSAFAYSARRYLR